MGNKASPVTGKQFKALSKEYKEEKSDEGLPPEPNLESSGEMLDSLDYQITAKGIKIGVFGDAAPRADGHNNLSGKSMLPERQFLPKKDEFFRSSIKEGVDRIIADAIAEQNEPPVERLRSVTSSASLYDILMPIFGLESRSETRLAVVRSPEWLATLEGLGLTRWL